LLCTGFTNLKIVHFLALPVYLYHYAVFCHHLLVFVHVPATDMLTVVSALAGLTVIPLLFQESYVHLAVLVEIMIQCLLWQN